MNQYHTHKFYPKKAFGIIGAPQAKSSSPDNSGVNHFPSLMREAGILEIIETCDAQVEDFGDAFERDDQDGEYESAAKAWEMDQQTADVRYVMNNASLGKTSYLLYDKVKSAIQQNKIPIVLGGDHGIATGSVAGSLHHFPDLILFFVDSHTDVNTPDTTVHGNYHGMPLSHLSGHMSIQNFSWMDEVPKLNAKNIVYIGLRDLYQSDIDLLEKYGMLVYTMNDVTAMGIGQIMKQSLEKLDPESKYPIHLSFDIDGADPQVAPGTGSQIKGGLSYTECTYICHFLNKTNRLVSMDFSEMNIDYDSKLSHKLSNRLPYKTKVSTTLEFAINLVASAVMGKGIQGVRIF